MRTLLRQREFIPSQPKFVLKIKLTIFFVVASLLQIHAIGIDSEKAKDLWGVENDALEMASNQQFEVNGTVLDQEGQPLPGANVLEKGTSNGVQTDFDGNFSLTVTDQNATLVVSYIGFKNKLGRKCYRIERGRGYRLGHQA